MRIAVLALVLMSWIGLGLTLAVAWSTLKAQALPTPVVIERACYRAA
jgi:hypothetical protein